MSFHGIRSGERHRRQYHPTRPYPCVRAGIRHAFADRVLCHTKSSLANGYKTAHDRRSAPAAHQDQGVGRCPHCYQRNHLQHSSPGARYEMGERRRWSSTDCERRYISAPLPHAGNPTARLQPAVRRPGTASSLPRDPLKSSAPVLRGPFAAGRLRESVAAHRSQNLRNRARARRNHAPPTTRMPSVSLCMPQRLAAARRSRAWHHVPPPQPESLPWKCQSRRARLPTREIQTGSASTR